MDDKNYKSDKKSLCNNAAEIEPKKKATQTFEGMLPRSWSPLQ